MRSCVCIPEERSPQMAQMCLVRDRGVPEDCAGTFIIPLMPTGGLMSSELLTEFIGEFNCNIYTHKNNTNLFRYTLKRAFPRRPKVSLIKKLLGFRDKLKNL